jgi:ribose transport system substrate-binding protein
MSEVGVRRRVLLGGAVLGPLAIARPLGAWSDPTPNLRVVLPSDRNQFWLDVARGADQAAKDLVGKASIRVAASRDQDAQNQTQLLRSFLARGDVSALVLGPASDSETVPIVSDYLQRRIPVIVIDTMLDQGELSKRRVEVTAFIGSNNLEGGRIAAQQMADAIPRTAARRVLVLEGSTVHQSAVDRTAGFTSECKLLDLEPIVVNADWRRDRAQAITVSQMARQSISGIFANNDDMALGSIAALKGIGLTPQAPRWPKVIGFDATPDARLAISREEMYASIKQDPERMGREGVVLAFRAAAGDLSFPRSALLAVSVVKR